MAHKSEMRKLGMAELERSGREALESIPAIKVRDMIAERAQAAVQAAKKWSPRTVDENSEPVGVWCSMVAIKKLNLHKLVPGTELLYDIVPNPGLSINGVVFAPGSRQLLPQNIWDGIYARTGERQRSEENFLYPEKEVWLKTIRYSGKPGRPHRF